MPTGRRHTLLRSAAVLVAVAFFAACGSSSGSKGASATTAKLTAADGSKVTLADLKGTPLVVNMWATWCHPCVSEMPALQQVAAGSGIGDVKIIGVNVGDDASSAAAFAKKLGVTYAQYTDPEGTLSTALKVTNLPATAFIAADGTVLEVHAGAFTAATLRAAIAGHFPATGGTT